MLGDIPITATFIYYDHHFQLMFSTQDKGTQGPGVLLFMSCGQEIERTWRSYHSTTQITTFSSLRQASISCELQVTPHSTASHSDSLTIIPYFLPSLSRQVMTHFPPPPEARRLPDFRRESWAVTHFGVTMKCVVLNPASHQVQYLHNPPWSGEDPGPVSQLEISPRINIVLCTEDQYTQHIHCLAMSVKS